MSNATPTPAPTAGHEMRRSTGGAYVAMYSPDCRTPIMPSSSSCCGVPVDSTRYTAQRGSLRCRLFFVIVWPGEIAHKRRSSAQAPPGIEGLGLSKEETRIVSVNTMHSRIEANFVPAVSYLLMCSQSAALLVLLHGTKLYFLSK